MILLLRLMRAATYAEHLLGHGRSAKTVRDYEREVGLALAWFDAQGLDLAEAQPSELIAYADTRPNTPSVRAHLRGALKYWWEYQGVAGWPLAIDIPIAPPMMSKTLNDLQARRLNRTAQGWWREGTCVLVGLHLGLRNAELCGMRWEGFDRPMEWYTCLGKGNRQRIVAVHQSLAGELAPYWRPSGFVFEGRFGGPVSHQTIRNWVRKVAVEVGIEPEDIWPHRLRHTFATGALEETKDLRAVQEAMGHARPETTARYTTASTVRLRKVSDAVARRFS